jgi:hypothetical protein
MDQKEHTKYEKAGSLDHIQPVFNTFKYLFVYQVINYSSASMEGNREHQYGILLEKCLPIAQEPDLKSE